MKIDRFQYKFHQHGDGYWKYGRWCLKKPGQCPGWIGHKLSGNRSDLHRRFMFKRWCNKRDIKNKACELYWVLHPNEIFTYNNKSI